MVWKRSESFLRLHCHLTFSIRPSKIWLLLFSKTIFTKGIQWSIFYSCLSSVHSVWLLINLWLWISTLSTGTSRGSHLSLLVLRNKKWDLLRAMEAVHLATIPIWLWWYSVSLLLNHLSFRYLGLLCSPKFKFVGIFYILKIAFCLICSYYSFIFI